MEHEYQKESLPKTSWPNFWQYCKKPIQLEPEKMHKKGPFLLRMLGLMFLVNFVQIILMFGTLDQNNDELTKLFQQYYEEFSYPVFALILIVTAVIIPAILEEIIFRFPLRLSPIHFNFFGNMATITPGQQLWSWFILLALLFYLSIGNNLNVGWLLLAFILVLTTYIWKNLGDNGKFYAGYPLFFGFLSLMFGLVHITNFDINNMPLSFAVIYSLIVYVLGRAALGVVLAYVRVRLGLIYSILLHGCNNFIIILLLLIAPDQILQF